MAITFPAAGVSSASAFDRHIKRLAWCALLGSLAILIPELGPGNFSGSTLTVALGAIVIVIAVLVVVRDISRYVRHEAARRRETARVSAQAGACRAADAIQDRVANLLSVTVGYVDFVTEDEQLNERTLEHARQARDSALAAARAVSAFRRSLGCTPVPQHVELAAPAVDQGRSAAAGEPAVRNKSWWYDDSRRTVRARDGTILANVRHMRDRSAELRTGRLIADAPALWDVLTDAQRVVIQLLARPGRDDTEEAHLRELLERINAVADQIEA